MVRTLLLALLLLVGVSLAACSGRKADLEPETEPGTTQTSGSRTADSGGDKPTLRELLFAEDDSGAQGGDRPAVEQELAQLRAEMRKAQSAEAARSTAAADRQGPGVAMVFPGASDAASTRAYTVLSRVAGDYPVTAVSPQRLQRATRGNDCPVERLEHCGRRVAAATGARVAAVIEGAEPTSEGLSLTVQLIDLDLGIRYPGYRIDLPASDDGTAEKSLGALADSVYVHALEHLRLAPQIFHVQGQQDDLWVLDTGDARFQSGDRFTAHSGGRILRVAGEPVAWIPDDAASTLAVRGTTGNGLLLLEHTGGRAPRPQDLVLPASR